MFPWSDKAFWRQRLMHGGHGTGPFGPSARAGAAIGAALLSATLVVGCSGADDPTTGTLVIPYTLGNNRDCEDLGVELIEVDLDDGYRTEEVACDEGEVRLEDVPAGTYAILLYGLDADGFPVMDSEEGGPIAERVFESSTTTVEPAVLLTAAPAQLSLRWNFGFGSCDSEDVDHFLVRAWHVDGTKLLLEAELPCATEGEGAGNYRRVPDPERELGGEVLGEVSVQPVDGNGNAVGEPVSFAFEPPGAGHPVRISLVDCDTSGCEGSGELD